MRISLILAICVLLLGCSKFDESLLHGEWEVKSWKIQETGEAINKPLDFTFKNDRRYNLDYGPKKEVGKYWIATDYLHTVEDGKLEKKVRIVKLTADSLIIEMNRAGRKEDVVLIRP